MPSPLDVAYAALGNDSAIPLLDDEIRAWGSPYSGALEGMRVRVDGQGEAFWQANLYNLWLSSLRALSPSDELDNPIGAGLPSVFTTEAWGRRILNTQLASWAELRHDTLLYAKQSYTAMLGCDYPDAYVEPYPEFFRAVADYANAGHVQTSELGLGGLDLYFTRLGEVASTLEAIAIRQRLGEDVTGEHLTFANEMIRLEDVGICAPQIEAHGWYKDLFHEIDPLTPDPTIADIHTQPTDAVGNPVGHILHVGTGSPRLMAITVDTPQGLRSFVGAVSSYHEVITSDFERLNDETWVQQLRESPDLGMPAWLTDLIMI